MPEKKPESEPVKEPVHENATKTEEVAEPELTPARKQPPEGVRFFFPLQLETKLIKKILSFLLFAFFENIFGRESEMHSVNKKLLFFFQRSFFFLKQLLFWRN